MATIEKSVEVKVPVRTAYNQWTQFEQFPEFMEGVKEVHQLDDRRLHWRAEIAGKDEEWSADIVEQIPDRRVSWRSTTGAVNSGTVTFDRMGENSTRVTLRLDYEPRGMMEKAGEMTGMVDRQVEGDLKRFRDFLESRGAETGAWRGEIKGEKVTKK